MLDETLLIQDEELDILVLTAKALEGHLILFTDAQRDVVMPYLRSLAAYEASRPAARRRASNILDFETALVKSRIEKYVHRQRQSALADGLKTLQHGENCFGDAMYPDDIE